VTDASNGYDSYDEQLQDAVNQFHDDPLGFIKFIFPWNDPDGPLKGKSGPDGWQSDVLESLKISEDGRSIKIAVASGHGVGKVTSNDSYVYTPEGKRLWGDIDVGDQLFGRDGTPISVINKFPHKNWDFYKVTFDDGSYLICGKEHLFNVRGRRERRNNLDEWRTLSVEDIQELGVKRKNGTGLARQWEIPSYKPVEFNEREIDFHPYFLGLWLGDGTKNAPRITKPYEEVFDRLRSFGYQVSTSEANNGGHYISGVSDLIRADNVFLTGSSGRYIPDNYKYNTIENRVELLKGLLDSDGEVHHTGSIGYSTTSAQLRDDIVWLVRSLGGKVKIQPATKVGKYKKDGAIVICNDCYRLTIQLNFNPFTVLHKQARYKVSAPRYITRWIDSIEYSHTTDGHCVEVSSDDHLYLGGEDFIVTHNSALVAMVVLWFMSTRRNAHIVVTANTQEQLMHKTWRELAKWHNMMLNKHWFKWTATQFYHVDNMAEWYATATPWSEHNTEAFAGLHHENTLIIFDEASGIPPLIWETAQGALTTSNVIWLAFGNPTKSVGRFFDCFNSLKDRWQTFKVDSRDAEAVTNKAEIAEWEEDYGYDSDFFRVRVRGEFPRLSSEQLIPSDRIQYAMDNKLLPVTYEPFPVVFGVDVAVSGTDLSVVCVRQDSKIHEMREFAGLDNMELASKVIEMYYLWNPTHIYVDSIGFGSGVYSRLRQLGLGDKVVGAMSSKSPTDRVKYLNKRAEMAFRMRDWFLGECDMPKIDKMKEELMAIEYRSDEKKNGLIRILEKSVIKTLIGRSPDYADALALTFFDTYVTASYDDEEDSYKYYNRSERVGMNETTGY
jgi:hypothetical protein